jgi:hypothetical protein
MEMTVHLLLLQPQQCPQVSVMLVTSVLPILQDNGHRTKITIAVKVRNAQ